MLPRAGVSGLRISLELARGPELVTCADVPALAALVLVTIVALWGLSGYWWRW